jgi:NAD(P)-dependent dehydrogenase (short-subunit alcohol dehydrogenase family)
MGLRTANGHRYVGWLANAKQLLLRLSRRLGASTYCCAPPAKVVPPDVLHTCRALLTCAAVIGSVEELAQTSRTRSLVDEIFEINFFANVNIIKAVLPIMRERKNGHIIVITGISMSKTFLANALV